MTCPRSPSVSNTAAILTSRSRIGEAERVVDQDRDRVLLGDQCRAGQPRQDAELLLGPARQRLVRDGATVQRAVEDAQVAVDVDLEARPENWTAEPLQFGAERLDVTQPGGVAVTRHHLAQHLHRAGPATDPVVLAAGVLTVDLGGVELAFAAFGAEYRELRGDLVQGARDRRRGAGAMPRPPRRRRPAPRRRHRAPAAANCSDSSATRPAAASAPPQRRRRRPRSVSRRRLWPAVRSAGRRRQPARRAA